MNTEQEAPALAAIRSWYETRQAYITAVKLSRIDSHDARYRHQVAHRAMVMIAGFPDPYADDVVFQMGLMEGSDVATKEA